MKCFVYQEPEECRLLWEKIWPQKNIFDLWQVRNCFHEAFYRPLRFHVLEDNKKIMGFFALCWNEEKKNYVQFPGETWHGKTWLEQNRIFAANPESFLELVDSVPGDINLRYLLWNPLLNNQGTVHQDETGYLFFPGLHDFNFENYLLSFSGASRKKLRAELQKLEKLKISYRFNEQKDLDHLFRMNIESFGEDSYFSNKKFYRSFENLAHFLGEMGMMRITTVLIGGKIAAVDMGGLWNNSYTLLAGGTDPDFPGVAKLINFHHLKWSCDRGIGVVDFLCGNFNWKERFHLTPRPLYELNLEKSIIKSLEKTHEAQAA